MQFKDLKENIKMKNIDKIISESINRFLKENIETEYLDKDFGIPLKKYLKMSDIDKTYERIWQFPNIAYNFLENKLGNYDEEEEELPFTEDELSELDEYDGDSLYSFIEEKLGNEGLEECGQYIYEETYGNPTTFDVMDYTQDIHNQWLVHFSDNAAYIADDGFRYATDELNDLGYSNAGETKGKSDEGWDFAYLANAVPRDGDKYGKEAVMFRASGIQASHYGDQEEQVMFWNKDAKDIVYIENGDSSDCYTQNTRGDYVNTWFIRSRITGEVLYDSDDIDDVIAWVENNFDQYRKHLISRKASKIRNKSLSNSQLNYDYKIK